MAVFNWDVLNNSFQTRAGNWATQDNVGFWLGKYVDNSGSDAQNDHVSIGAFNVPTAGTYTIYITATQNTNCGIAHVYVNGVDVAQIDTYNAVSSESVVFTDSLGTLSAGIKNVSLKVATKNAASTGYRLQFESVTIIKTA
jgi:hypothetical protein